MMKQTMKKTLMVFAALMTAFFMISCQNETTSENNTEEEKDTTAEKIAIYNKLVGTTWENEYKGRNVIYNNELFQDVSFFDDAIMLNNDNELKYSINKSTDLFFYSDFSSTELEEYKIQDKYFDNGVYFIVCLNETYYTFSYYDENSGRKKEVVIEWGVPTYTLNDNIERDFKKVYLELVSDSNTEEDSGSSTSTDTVTVDGDYTISQANGSTISFSDGNWTYSYLSSSKTGTYSQSGNELTMNYSAGGYSVSAVFTVAKDGDNVKLTGKSGDYSTIVGSAFMVKDSDALTNGVVTLTAK